MKLALLTILFSVPCMAMIQEKFNIDPQSLSVPKRLQNLSVYHEKNEFHVVKDGTDSIVKSHRMDTLLLKLKKNRPELQSYLRSSGYLTVGESEDGQFSLEADGRIVGGGPVTGAICYWGVKCLAYVGISCMATAAVTAVAPSLPAAGAASAIGTVAKAAIGANLATSAVGTGLTTTIAAAGGANAVAYGAAGTLASCGSIGTAVALVESAATSAGLFGLAIPFLP